VYIFYTPVILKIKLVLYFLTSSQESEAIREGSFCGLVLALYVVETFLPNAIQSIRRKQMMIKRLAFVFLLLPLLVQGCASKKDRVLTSPSSIESQIENRLKGDPLTAAWQINPNVEKNTVTLTGLVDKEEERRRAEELTRTVVGELRKIDNQIMLANEVILDNSITAKLKNDLISDPITRAASIEVQSRKGVVILNGKVHSNEQKRQAEVLAKDIAGVSHVENHLKVKG